MNTKKARELAIPLMAADQLSDWQIAEKVGVSRQSIANWKKIPAFMAEVESERQRQTQALRSEGITNKQNRLDAYNRRWKLLHAVIDERAEEMQDDAAGTGTGLLVRQVKSVGFGPNNHTVEEYAVDTGLLKELRELERQAAVEMGQWEDKHSFEGEVLIRGYGGIPSDTP